MSIKFGKIFLTILSFYFLSVLPSLALSPLIQQKKDQIIQKYTQNIQNDQYDQGQNQPDTATSPSQIKQQIQQKIEDNQALRTQNRLQVAQKISTMIRQKLEQRFTYLSHFQQKIQDHLDQLNGQGFDTSQASLELAKVEQIIANYQLHLSDLSTLEQSLTEADNPAQLSNQLRQASQLVNSDLIQYRHTLRQTLTLLIRSLNR